MDIKRIVSSVLGLPMVIIVILFGNKYIIDIAMSIVAIISLHEYYNAVSKDSKPIKWLGYVTAALISLIHIINIENLYKIAILMVPIIITILFIQLIIDNMKHSFKDIAVSAFGIFYIVYFISFIPLIAGTTDGKIYVWYAIIAAWGTDIFAYLVGKKIGKHKFSKISPKKSIEGCIAGVIGAVALAIIYTACLNLFFNIVGISYIKVIIITAILSVISQFGDFAASSIKRSVGIKDFSNLIPGHGGLLDRIDSLIFVAPFAYILLDMMFILGGKI